MAQNKFKKFMDIMMAEEPKTSDLKKIGITQEEHEEFRNVLLGIEHSSYNRIMTKDEKNLFTADAFGYLVRMVHKRSITKEDFENVINVCLQLRDILKIKLTKDNVDDILNYVVFLNTDNLDIRMVLETLLLDNNSTNDNELN